MKFIEDLWRVERGSSYLKFKIEWWKNSWSVWDQVWISTAWDELHVLDYSDEDVLQELIERFDKKSRLSFQKALSENGIKYE